LRWRGIYLVLGTLALHFIALYIFAITQSSLVGPIGFRFNRPEILGLRLNSDFAWYYVAAGFAAINVASVALLTRSHIGRAWTAVRHNSLAASALGVSITRSTLTGVTIGSCLAGMSGAMMAYFNSTATYDSFTLNLTIQYLSVVLIGGVGTL